VFAKTTLQQFFCLGNQPPMEHLLDPTINPATQIVRAAVDGPEPARRCRALPPGNPLLRERFAREANDFQSADNASWILTIYSLISCRVCCSQFLQQVR